MKRFAMSVALLLCLSAQAMADVCDDANAKKTAAASAASALSGGIASAEFAEGDATTTYMETDAFYQEKKAELTAGEIATVEAYFDLADIQLAGAADEIVNAKAEQTAGFSAETSGVALLFIMQCSAAIVYFDIAIDAYEYGLEEHVMESLAWSEAAEERLVITEVFIVNAIND